MRCLVLVSAGCAAAAVPARAPEPIPIDVATRYFAEAEATCARDHARMWGVSLCGPTMFADRATRAIVANRADPAGLLRPRRGAFVGVLPADQNIANTAFEWGGVR